MKQLFFLNSQSAFMFDKNDASLPYEVIKTFTGGGDIFKRNFQRMSLSHFAV